MGKGSSPKPPNYAAAATEQGNQNRQTYLDSLNAGRYNQSDAFGSQQWRYTGPDIGPAPTRASFSSDGDYQKALADYQRQQFSSPGNWSLDTSLSPEMQSIYDTGYGAYQKAMQGLAGSEFDQSKVAPQADWTKLVSALDGNGDQYTQAYYDKATRLLGDKYGSEEGALRSQLLNSGLSEGTQAYDHAMKQFMDSKNGNYSDIANQAILGGSQMHNQDINTLVQALSAQDQGRMSSIQQEEMLRMLPLDEANKILAGLRISNYGSGTAGGGYQAPDIMGATQAQYQSNLDRWNAQQAQRQQMINTGMNLGSMATLLYAL